MEPTVTNIGGFFFQSPPLGAGLAATVPPPPQSASRRRTTSSTSSNPTANIFDTAVVNGQHSQPPPPPSLLIDKQISSSSSTAYSGAGELHSLGSFESPAMMGGSDPFDTSHVTRLVNGHHAASTPIPRTMSSTSSPPLGPGSISSEMSQAPSAIMGHGTRSTVNSDFSSPSSMSVFGTPAHGECGFGWVLERGRITYFLF